MKDETRQESSCSRLVSNDLFDGGDETTRSGKPEQARKFVVKVSLNNEPSDLPDDHPIAQIFNSVFNQE